jgi:predicted membrane protein
LNKERLPLTGWIENYRKIIFVFSILALLTVLFITIAVAYAFLVDINSFTERQRPFYILFLLLLLVSAVTYVLTTVGYFKSVKENKKILSEYISEIGSTL